MSNVYFESTLSKNKDEFLEQVPSYTKIPASSACPYCSSDNIEIIFKAVIPTILHACKSNEASLSRLFPVHMALCHECTLGFNASPLPEGVLESLYRNYRYIKPRKNIGVSKYRDVLHMIRSLVTPDENIVEIGASDGFLIDTLIEEGYSNIEGFEPSQEWEGMRYKDRIRNEFFTADTILSKPVDVFLLMHVLEHFARPWEALRVMEEKLKNGGKIIFEVPNFSGVHHQHLVYFSDVYLQRLADDLGLEILSMETTENVIRVCLKKTHHTKVFVQRKKRGADYLLRKIKNRIEDSLNDLEMLKELIKTADNVFWWGAGSSSIMVLSDLGAEICREKKFFFIDSDEERRGLVLPVPFLNDHSIELPSDACPRIKEEDLLVIASSFSGEIMDTINKNRYIIPENIMQSIRLV